MIHITYNQIEISVNIALLKSRLKLIAVWILKTLRTVTIISGIFLLLGTAGASDLNSIVFSQMIYQLLLSLLLFGLAYVLELIKTIIE